MRFNFDLFSKLIFFVLILEKQQHQNQFKIKTMPYGSNIQTRLSTLQSTNNVGCKEKRLAIYQRKYLTCCCVWMKTAFMQSNNNPILVRYFLRILNKFNDIILYALTIKVNFFPSLLSLSLSSAAQTNTHFLLSSHRFAWSDCMSASNEITRRD